MPRLKNLCYGLLALAMLAPALHAAPPQDFYGAKSTADADEASQDATAKAAMLTKQRALLDAGVKACATDDRTKADLSNFVVVMRLDAEGQVAQTWRHSDSPLALCMERYVREKILFVPPRNPFYTSLEISFVP